MKQPHYFVFSLILDYLEDLTDISNLRTALKDTTDSILYTAWIRYLKNLDIPLIFKRNFVTTFPGEKKYLLELVKDECDKAFQVMQAEKRYNPYDTLLAALENAKHNLEPYILKAKGPEPNFYAGDIEYWEDYDSDVDGFERDVMFEDFWKGGGREGEALSKAYQEWHDADADMEGAWLIVINDTINILKEGAQLEVKPLDSKAGRKIMLTKALNNRGLNLRNDSVLCQSFIDRGSGEIDNIVQIMVEMNFLHGKTDYPRRVRNKNYGISIEVIKLYAVDQFIKDYPDRAKEVPNSLLIKLNNRNSRK